MTAHQIATLNGLLAAAAAERARAGDPRGKSEIVADLLWEVQMPDLRLVLQRLKRRARRAACASVPAAASRH
jgi:hypothetical protein